MVPLDITFEHIPILLHVGDFSMFESPFRFENVWLEVEGFSNLVKAWWDESFKFLVLLVLYLQKKLKSFKHQIER